MPKALVTGGAGFIGSHLCESLLRDGWEVTCVDNFITGSRDNVSHLSDLRVVEGDVNEERVFAKLAKDRFDVLFHYAALVGVRRTEEQPLDVLEDVQGLRNIAAFARAGHAKKVVYASSSEVYGTGNRVPMAESEGILGWSPYTTVKLFGEHLLRSLWDVHRIPTVSLRFFNVYGPRQIGNPYGFVVAQFVRQALEGQRPTVFGNGRQTRDFVFIDDNIRAALSAFDRTEANGTVVNVGTGKETTIRRLAGMVVKGVGNNELVPAYLPARDVEVRRRCASPARMRDVLGMTCDTKLTDGLGAIITYEREQLEAQRAASVQSPATVGVQAV